MRVVPGAGICVGGVVQMDSLSISRVICLYASCFPQPRPDRLSTPPGHSSPQKDIPEQLVELIRTMIPGAEGNEQSDAFQFAADFPPITKQSLSELDIQNIITNIKLRHDVNFDRDLSFRPNLDGGKGQEKLKAAKMYWRALVAELELYVRLFQGSPPLELKDATWSQIVLAAQKRIPKMFETIQEVLKSLVPDRDHSRVAEHLDVPMLMQEIERGVCDLVRLAEWVAHLLKEHCAPMRDEWVDKMVEWTKSGVSKNSSELIVSGLRELLGILEAMKLDVANHQIRNLKTLLIEDTVNFERHYHLDRLVNGKARVNVESAQKWYAEQLGKFRQLSTPQRSTMHLKFEVFVRAVVSTLFSNDSRCDLPETFYLDQDRLRSLKAEIDDLVLFEICLQMFQQLLKEFGYTGPIPQSTRRRLRTSLFAIIGEGVGHGPAQWKVNTEALSLELIRQAQRTSGRLPNCDHNTLQEANRHLLVETGIFPQVLACAIRHNHSSPMELFNTLIAAPSNALSQTSQPTLHAPFAHETLSPPPELFTDLSNRITHILLLHWRVWGPIAYVTEEDSKPMSQIETPEEQHIPIPIHTMPPPPVETSPETTAVTVLKTV
ncbi:Tcp11-domain-containing protein [Amniculicola lignicola CBS 123094]|uniref:Tcp11-domain-containing protein n=1 Tax=Amniculicola lignicola CBS 123094 TaxID=1392246 RepID=A0A6A5WUI6_9PLEO|nr:Tcp11-domain-containing protein [Amniculicola lignicola CBS 123094]